MKLAVFVAIMAIALPAPAFASDWVLVHSSEKNNRLYFHRQSIRTMPNGHKQAWAWLYLSKPTSQSLTRARGLFEFDCSGARHRILQEEPFNGRERLPGTSGPRGWNYIAPGTRFEKFLNYVCFDKR